MELTKQIQFAKQDPDTVDLPKVNCHPDNLIDLIKGKITAINTTEDENDIIENQPASHVSDDVQQTNDDNLVTEDICSENASPKKLATQHSLAVQALNDNGITLVPSMKAFMIKGSKGNKYSVTLFPNESCNCPATTRCCHIIAAMMSIGMPIPNDKKKINLTQLRWNMRPKHSKRCGTKKGRKGDTDDNAILPAPDSVMKLNQTSLLQTPINESSINENCNKDDSVNVRKSLNFLASTPKSILKKKSKCTTSEKKRKLSFVENGNDKKVKMLKTEEENVNKLEELDETKIGILSKIEEDEDELPQLEKMQTIEEINMSCQNIKKESDLLEEENELPELENMLNENLPKIDVKIKIENKEHFNSTKNDENIEEILVLECSRNDEILEENKFWNKDLQLTEEDKNDLLNNKKLSSRHIHALNILLKREVGNKINGLQLSELVPVKLQHENRWILKFPMEPVNSPACQIHHTHNDHWVASLFHRGNIYLLDSLGTDRKDNSIIPDGLKIQLSQIYGRQKYEISIKIPEVMKQNNSIDCGLYAMAFITSYCFRQKLCFDLIFDSNKLRPHLFQCFENNSISEFPLTSKTISLRRKKKDKIIAIKNYCICNLPECFDDMVQCDKCRKWFHKYCINAPFNISLVTVDYFCDECQK